MKPGLRRFLIFLLIAALSVGFGFGFDAAATAIEKKHHPCPGRYAEMIRADAAQFGVPEAVICGTVLTQSGFDGGYVSEDSGVGLFAITPALYETICRSVLDTEPQDAGILYDPETNLRVGTAYLSYLYGRYGAWKPAYAALLCGTETVDGWMRDEKNLSSLGTLEKMPDAKLDAAVREICDAVDAYARLYDK